MTLQPENESPKTGLQKFKSIADKILHPFGKRIRKVPETFFEKVFEFFRSLFSAAIAALFIITFFIQNTRIPTGSMEDTILVGDFILVNKFVYGPSSPKYIPFTEIEIPYFTMPFLKFKDPHHGDIVVFEYPGNKEQLRADERIPGLPIPEEQIAMNVNYVKRCIGLPGDTIEVRNKVVFVNGKEFWIPPYIKYLSPYPLSKDRVNTQIFPKGKQWNEDNYGPLVIPKKGMEIQLNLENVEEWRTIIDREFAERVVEVKDGIIIIKGKEVHSYTFQKDYYFMMGDNRDDSADSRFWGFVSRDMVVGEAFMSLFSWDRDIPFSELFRLIGSIRTDRILKLIH